MFVGGIKHKYVYKWCDYCFLYRSFLSFHGESLVDVVISHHWRMIDYTIKSIKDR